MNISKEKLTTEHTEDTERKKERLLRFSFRCSSVSSVVSLFPMTPAVNGQPSTANARSAAQHP
jgi:hypothetical protein